ncbi:aldehyde dehydrogenase, partial [Streptomyces sp. SID9124]|nr:aldehyde dehydrogenase [Streptomyces sp. SID9124]
MPTFDAVAANRATRPGTRFAVVDPATGEPFDEAPDMRPEELDAVVGRAHRAWPGWRADAAAR